MREERINDVQVNMYMCVCWRSGREKCRVRRAVKEAGLGCMAAASRSAWRSEGMCVSR
jgi:hypothetical protein